MAEDLKILDPRGPSRTLIPSVWPNSGIADGQFALVQKIVKNLHTAPGEVETDPTFGSDLPGSVVGVPGQDTDRAKQIISGVLAKCVEDLTLEQPDDPDQRLVSLRLEEVEYSASDTTWYVRVIAESETTIVEFDVGV